jgi:CheY-like chemotaxis protein
LDGVKISIADSGIGIENENIAKLFTKFSQFTNDSTRNMEGTGLGLAISMGLVKLMGGDIEVESELNKGSCFTVVLPHKRITEVKSAANISGSHKASDLSLSGRSILVVDDIAMNCVVLEEMLMIFGADELLSVCSGEEAVAFISENMNTDIILMDMRMPGMDGVEATHKIRQLGYKGDIIAVTANASTQDRQACIDAGMNDFIAKPVEVDALEIILLKLMHS